jgi:hypothetical protein
VPARQTEKGDEFLIYPHQKPLEMRLPSFAPGEQNRLPRTAARIAMSIFLVFSNYQSVPGNPRGKEGDSNHAGKWNGPIPAG